MDLDKRGPTRVELEHLKKRISSTEVNVGEVRQELERIRNSLSTSIKEALDSARKQALEALQPLQAELQSCKDLLRTIELRDRIRAEEEERARRQQAEYLAQADTRVKIALEERKSGTDITGAHRALANTDQDRKHQQRVAWTKIAISVIIGAGGGQAILHLLGK